jgi:hypothetical protein
MMTAFSTRHCPEAVHARTAELPALELRRVVEALVHSISSQVRLSRIIAFGSGAAALTNPRDFDLLALVAPDTLWAPADNVQLRSAVYSRLGAFATGLDLYVRTIDQFEEAQTVPVCPEHSAAVDGVLVWSSAVSRAPRPRRSTRRVLVDNAIDWLRVAEHARAAMHQSKQARLVAPPTSHPPGDVAAAEVRSTHFRHFEKAARATVVAWSLATGSPLPHHKTPLGALLQHEIFRDVNSTVPYDARTAPLTPVVDDMAVRSAYARASTAVRALWLVEAEDRHGRQPGS